MKVHFSTQSPNPFLIGSVFLLLGILFETLLILYLNSGFFVYSMDDPYIHLAIAENIANGNYGINSNEFSSPSSSILWPFLLVPFVITGLSTIGPFILNIITTFLTYFLFFKIFQFVFHDQDIEKGSQNRILLYLMVFILPISNIISLSFIGMEHSLQVLVTAYIIYGLMYESIHNKVLPLLIISILVAPLVRYECFAISVPAILYLLSRKHYKVSVLCVALIALTVGGFSYFLILMGQEALPSSVMAKLANAEFSSSGISLKGFVMKLFDKLNSASGVIMIIATILLGYQGFFNANRKVSERLFSIAIGITLVLHLLFGQFGFLGRYDTYIWICALFSIFFIYRSTLTGLVLKHKPLKFSLIFLVVLLPLSLPYLKAILLTPIAANNIYEQHYQMHRFAVDYYGKKVAVNDLGYVSYQNPNYVLDLWGLGSHEALNYRKHNSDFDWIGDLSEKKQVKFAMIYDFWFKNIPDHWIKVGELHLGKMKVSPGESIVSFYALDQETYTEVQAYLEEYSKSLPSGVKFIEE